MEEQKEGSVLNPIQSLLYFFLIFLVVGVIFQLGFTYFINAFYGEEYAHYESYPDFRFKLIAFQGLSLVGAFLLPALIYINFFKIKISDIISVTSLSTKLLALSVLIMLVAFPFVVSMQEAMKQFSFSSELIELENEAQKMTEYMMEMNSLFDLFYVLIVVALVAGIVEEFFFRGILQPLFYNLFNNMHVAIWVSATIFSLIHFQVYGFPSRVIMGAVLGYIFYWSGSLKYAMIAHAFNNGFQVIVTYILSKTSDNFNIDEEASFPIYLIVFSLAGTIALLFYLKQNFDNEVGNSI